MHLFCGPLGLAHAPRNCASPILLPYFRSSSLAQHDTGIRTVSSNWCLSFHAPSSFLFHIPGSESFTRLLVDMSVCRPSRDNRINYMVLEHGDSFTSVALFRNQSLRAALYIACARLNQVGKTKRGHQSIIPVCGHATPLVNI